MALQLRRERFRVSLSITTTAFSSTIAISIAPMEPKGVSYNLLEKVNHVFRNDYLRRVVMYH
jgi:hypothetical protein